MLEEIWHEKGGISSTSKGLKKPVRNKEDLTLYPSTKTQQKPRSCKQEMTLARKSSINPPYRCWRESGMNKEVFLPLQKARRNLAGIGKIWRCTLPDNAEKKPVRNKEVFLALRIDWRNWAGIRKICCCIPLETLWRNLACAKRNFLLEEPCQEQGRFDAVFSLAESDEDSWAISAEELSGKSCILAHVLIGAKFMLNSDWLDQTVLPYDWPCWNPNHH